MYNIDWTKQKQKEVLTLIDIYIKKYPYVESIFQSEVAQNEGLQLLSEISDIVQPTRTDSGQPKFDNWDNDFGDHAIF